MLSEEMKMKSKSPLLTILSQNQFKSPSISPLKINLSSKNYRYGEQSNLGKQNFKTDEINLLSSRLSGTLQPEIQNGTSKYFIEPETHNHPLLSVRKSPLLKPDLSFMNLRISPSELRAKVL